MTESMLRSAVVPGLPDLPAAVLDPRRLAAVADTGLLDTGPEAAFDDLGALAALVTGSQRAFVTLVDSRRSFWKTVIGAEISAIEDRQNSVHDSPCQILVATDQPLIAPDAAADSRIKDLAAVRDLGIGAWAGHPIHGPDGQVLGGLCVVDKQARPWTPDQMRGLATLARAVSTEIALRQALARAEATAADLETTAQAAAALARTLQDSLLPPVIAQPPGTEAAAVYLPASGGAQVVGDFYDLFHTQNEWWYAVLGDVCGKGLEAAKVTALARYTIRAEATQHVSPVTVLERLNQALITQRVTDKFLTCVSVSFKASRGGLSGLVCTAGHPPALLRRADGTVEQIGRPALVLGIFDDIELAADYVQLDPGDAILLYTDGITDARRVGDDARFEVQRLTEVLAGCHDLTADQITDRVIAAVLEYTGGHRSDDTALLVLRVPAA